MSRKYDTLKLVLFIAFVSVVVFCKSTYLQNQVLYMLHGSKPLNQPDVYEYHFQ